MAVYKVDGTEAALRNFMVSAIALAVVLLVGNNEVRTSK